VECEKCDRAFRLNLSLKVHMRTVHSDSHFELDNQVKNRCTLCTYFSYSTKSLSLHMFLAHPKAKLKYNCHICRKQFETKKLAEQHHNTAKHREEVKKLRMKKEDRNLLEKSSCRFCGSLAADLTELKDHLLEKHLNLLPQCTLCGSKFLFSQLIPSHVRKKCAKDDSCISFTGQFCCDLCSFSSDLQTNVTMHRILKHSDKSNAGETRSPGERCIFCGKIFSRKNLKRHLLIHGKQVKCDFCYKAFEDPDELVQHKMKIHSDSDIDLKCSQCEYKTKKKQLLILHMKRMGHGGDERHQNTLVECGICGKVFSNKANLKRHVQSHTGNVQTAKLYKCDFEGCEYSCQYQSDMTRHGAKHLSSKSLVCNFCDFSCKRPNELKRHFKQSHTDTFDFQCASCDYKSNNGDHYKRHLNIHARGSEMDIFVCPLNPCRSEYRDKSNLKKHFSKVHSDRGLYICVQDHCVFETNDSKSFQDHLRQLHSQTLGEPCLKDYVKNFHLKRLPMSVGEDTNGFLLCDPPNFITEQIVET
jgi:KRAB domain-containing zinc finger protein